MKQTWKAGNMLYPIPAVMVTVTDGEGNDNVLTIAWTGTVCTNPALLYISVRKERYSYDMLKKTGEFVVNLTTEELAFATDFCGVRSGKDVDKFAEMKLTKEADGTITYTRKNVARQWNDKMYLYPIPQAELLKNPNLTQNSGW